MLPCAGDGAAGPGAARPRPTADEVGKRTFGREQVVAALKEHFPAYSHPQLQLKKGAAVELKEALQALLQGVDPGPGQGPGAAGDGGGGGGARKAPRASDHRPVDDHEDAVATQQRASAAASAELVRQFTAGNEDMTFSVRLVLDAKAWALPKGLDSLRTIAKQLEHAQAAAAGKGLMPHKLHRAVLPCAQEPDAQKQQAMFVALQADLDKKIIAAQALKQHQTGGAEGPALRDKHAPDPVLVAMGAEGRDRALWEYYKASVRKPPAWGKRALMRFDATSYVGQLYAVLEEGLGPEATKCKQLQTAKKLRDFVVDWCEFWKNTRPPFLGVGEKKDWTYDQWEQLPMHSMQVEGLRTVPSDPWAPGDTGPAGEEGEGDDDMEGMHVGDAAGNDAEVDDNSHGCSDERAWAKEQLGVSAR